MWKIKIITDWNKIEEPAFVASWLKIMDESPNAHVFFHPALVKVWLETYRPLRDLELLFVIGSKDEKTILFPLVKWNQNWKNGFRKLIVPIGYSDFDYHDPISSHSLDPDEIQLFYLSLHKQLDSYDLINYDGLHTQFIPKFSLSTGNEPCPYIDTSSYSSMEEYLGQINKSVRKNYLRRKSNLEKEYEVQYLVCETNEQFEDLKDSIPQMMDIHSKRWPKAYKAPGFHSKLLDYGLKAGILRLFAIKVDDNFLAWRITFSYKGVLYLYMPTFNPEYMKFSPGIQSLCFCVDYCIHNRYTKIDQLRGSEDYKKDWSSGYEQIYNVDFRSSTLSSQLKSIFISLKRRLTR